MSEKYFASFYPLLFSYGVVIGFRGCLISFCFIMLAQKKEGKKERKKKRSKSAYSIFEISQ